jgi:hypothetical protein
MYICICIYIYVCIPTYMYIYICICIQICWGLNFKWEILDESKVKGQITVVLNFIVVFNDKYSICSFYSYICTYVYLYMYEWGLNFRWEILDESKVGSRVIDVMIVMN